MSAQNREAVRRSFARQAAAFEDPSRRFGRADVMAWMAAHTPVERTDVVLEVASGTALFGRAIADRVAAVIAVDLTPAMLAEGKAAAEATGVENVIFQHGDATALPFLDSSFDRTLSRLAIHHFDDPAVPLAEMARVTKPDGTVIIIDMVVIEEDSVHVFNDLERRRDPAHTRALTRHELWTAVEAAGLTVIHTATWENVLDGHLWLDQTNTSAADAAHIREAWEVELAGGSRTGMSPRRRDGDGELEFVHHWDLLVAAKAPT